MVTMVALKHSDTLRYLSELQLRRGIFWRS